MTDRPTTEKTSLSQARHGAARLLMFGAFWTLLLAPAAGADPFRVDVESYNRRVAALREQAKHRDDPHELLKARRPELSLRDVKLTDAFRFLDNTGLRGHLLVDWRAMKAAGIAQEARINLHRRENNYAALLTATLDAADARRKSINFAVADELIVVSDAQGIARIKRWVAVNEDLKAPQLAAGPRSRRIAVANLDLCLGPSFGLSVGPERLEDAIKTLSHEAGVAIQVDWSALRRCGIEADDEVAGSIPNVSITCALAVLLWDFDNFDRLKLSDNGQSLVLSAR